MSYDTPESAIEAAQKEIEGYIEFEGMNCDPEERECQGWDGYDHRCDCGNRRVGWEVEKENDGYVAYARAW